MVCVFIIIRNIIRRCRQVLLSMLCVCGLVALITFQRKQQETDARGNATGIPVATRVSSLAVGGGAQMIRDVIAVGAPAYNQGRIQECATM